MSESIDKIITLSSFNEFNIFFDLVNRRIIDANTINIEITY